MTRIACLWVSIFIGSALADRILKVFGKLPNGFANTGYFDVLIEDVPIKGESFFLESAQKQYQIIPDNPSSSSTSTTDEHVEEESKVQYTDGPLIPIEYAPFSSSLDWQLRSPQFIYNLDIAHLRILGEYVVRFIIPEQTPNHPVFFVDDLAEFEYLLGLCFSEEGWELGWIVPHVPHQLLYPLPSETKEVIMNSLIIGDNHRGGWVSQVDYNRVRTILEPASTSQSYQSSISVTEESSLDETEPLEAAVARLAGTRSDAKSTPRNISSAPTDLALHAASIQRIRTVRAQRKLEREAAADQPVVTENVIVEDKKATSLTPPSTPIVSPKKNHKKLTKSRRKRKEKAKKRITELKHHKVPQPTKPKSSRHQRDNRLRYHCLNMAILASIIQH